MSKILQLNQGGREDLEVRSKAAIWSEVRVSAFEGRLHDFLATLSQDLVLDAAVHQPVAWRLPVAAPNEVISCLRCHCMEQGIVGIRDRASEVDVPGCSPTGRCYQSICLLEQMVGIRN